MAELGQHAEEGVESDVVGHHVVLRNFLVDFSFFGSATFASNLLHDFLDDLLLKLEVVHLAEVSVKSFNSSEEFLAVVGESCIGSAKEELGEGVEEEVADNFITVGEHGSGDGGEVLLIDALELLKNLLLEALFDFVQIVDGGALILDFFIEDVTLLAESANLLCGLLVFLIDLQNANW